MLKNSVFPFVLAAAALVFAGCNGNAGYVYSDNRAPRAGFRAEAPAGATLAVVPFDDIREYDDYGSAFLGLIPLMPFGIAGSGTPESFESFYSLSYYDMDVSRDLAVSAERAFKSSGLFSRVSTVGSPAGTDAKYILYGTVLKCDYKARWFTYGLTYLFAPPLWAVGAPTGSSSVDLELRLELVERESGKTVWSYADRENDYLNHWLYCRYESDMDILPTMVGKLLNRAVNNLHACRVVED